MLPLLPALLLLPASTLASPAYPNQRALEIPTEKLEQELRSVTQYIPQGVNVGEVDLFGGRFIYTYVNSTSILGTVALGLAAFLLVAVGLYLYDIYIGGSTSRGDEDAGSTEYYHYDPYGYSSLYDSTTRIRRYVTPLPLTTPFACDCPDSPEVCLLSDCNLSNRATFQD
jgi:hypothetical protein